MSKKIKSLIERQLGSTLKDVEGVAVLNPVGLDGKKNNALRKKLHGQGLKMLMVKNSLARRASGTTKIKGFDKLLSGPSAVVYGFKTEVTAIARFLVDEKKENEKLELRGVFFEGEAFEGEKGVETVSKFPTRTEAISQLVGSVMGPAGQLAACFDQAAMIASLIKAVEEKKEKETA